MNQNKTYFKHGFTLFELMIVLSLMGVVSTISITGFFRMTDYWNALQENVRLNKIASNAFDMLAADFENMLSSQVSGVTLSGHHTNTEDNINLWRISFEDDVMTFPVKILNPLTQELEQLLITYAIDRDGDEPQLARKIMSLGAPDQEPAITALFEDVAGMRIGYFDGKSWQTEWNGTVSPRLVRVSLSLIDGDRTDRQLARVVTLAVPVQ